MRKFLFATSFLAICSCNSLWAATIVVPSQPEVGVTIPTGGTTDFLINLVSCSAATDTVVSAPTSTCFSGSGSGTGFTWTVSGDEDPSLSWTFGSTLPGNYTVTFVTPIVGGLSYDMLQNAASLTITNLSGTATTVTNIDVKAEVPAGNNIGAVELMDPSFSVPSGDINGATIGNSTVDTAFPTPTSMEVVLSYTATGSGSVGFVGQALLTTSTPEPNNFVIAGLGMLAVLFLGRRKFRKA